MLFELKSVFQNDGEEKQVEYNLDLSGLDVDGVYPFKTPVVVTAKATNRASLITLVINAHFDYSRDCDRCGEPYTKCALITRVIKLALFVALAVTTTGVLNG